MIEFRCFKNDFDGYADPSHDGSEYSNWILNLYEGEYKNGLPDGFSRQINAYNGFCKLGYYKMGKPWGKWCEFSSLGKDWNKEGIFAGEGKCVASKRLKDFIENEEPAGYMGASHEQELLSQFERQRAGAKDIKLEEYKLATRKDVGKDPKANRMRVDPYYAQFDLKKGR